MKKLGTKILRVITLGWYKPKPAKPNLDKYDRLFKQMESDYENCLTLLSLDIEDKLIDHIHKEKDNLET
jgi:hypothetical protein